MLNKFSISPMQFSDISSVLAISDVELGNEYLTQLQLEEWLNQKEENFIFVAKSESLELLGFGIALCANKDELKAWYPSFSSIEIIQFLFSYKKIGLLKSIAVKDKFKYQGIGTTLAKTCLECFDESNIKFRLALAWKTKNGIHMDGVLKKQSFDLLVEIENFWSKESLQFQYTCPVCGSPPCKCTAVIYVASMGLDKK